MKRQIIKLLILFFVSLFPLHAEEGTPNADTPSTWSLHNVSLGIEKLFSHIYNAGRDVVSFTQGKLAWFSEVRTHFEDVAFKVMHKSLWTLLGYNPDATSVGTVGSKAPPKNVRITMINGILNGRADVIKHASTLSRLHGDVEVYYLYSASAGFTADVSRSLAMKVGLQRERAELLSATWKRLIQEMGGVESGGMIMHYAHSIGGEDSYYALQRLSPQERKMISVHTFGSPFLIPQGAAADVKNYVSRRDGVPFLDTVRYLQGLNGNTPDVIFLDSKAGALPLVDHYMMGPTYKAALEGLGNAFKGRFLTKSYTRSPGSILRGADFGLKTKKINTLKYKSPVTLFLEKVQEYLQGKRYHELGLYMAGELPEACSLEELYQLAMMLHDVPFQKAVLGARNLCNLHTDLEMSRGQMLQITLFIETELQNHLTQRQYYLYETKTGLSKKVEYDPKCKHIYIHTGKIIGRGWHKIVYLSILYSPNGSRLCANCRASTKAYNKKEMGITKRLQGIPGIVKGYSFIEHAQKQDGEDKIETILKLYNKKSLRNIGTSLHFTLKEKISIATQLLRGIAGMHRRGLVHCDLHTANFFVHVTTAPTKPRKIEAAVADLGGSMYVKQCRRHLPQAFLWYLAPEGFFYQRLRGKAYTHTDVYAMGCVLYLLFHEKDPPWFQDKYYANLKRSFKTRLRPGLIRTEARRHLAVLKHAIMPRRHYLAKKRKRVPLTVQERFEAIMLCMLHPVPHKRLSAAVLYRKLKRLK